MTKETNTNVVSIVLAKAKRDAKIETAPLEAFEPGATKIDGTDDWIIQACDGEQVYIWTATKKKGAKNYRVTEVYPGLMKRRTEIRDATEAADLVLDMKCASIPDVIEDLSEIIFEDMEEDDEDDGTDG